MKLGGRGHEEGGGAARVSAAGAAPPRSSPPSGVPATGRGGSANASGRHVHASDGEGGPAGGSLRRRRREGSGPRPPGGGSSPPSARARPAATVPGRRGLEDVVEVVARGLGDPGEGAAAPRADPRRAGWPRGAWEKPGKANPRGSGPLGHPEAAEGQAAQRKRPPGRCPLRPGAARGSGPGPRSACRPARAAGPRGTAGGPLPGPRAPPGTPRGSGRPGCCRARRGGRSRARCGRGRSRPCRRARGPGSGAPTGSWGGRPGLPRHPDRLGEVALLAQLLGQLGEEPRARLALDAPPQLVDAGIGHEEFRLARPRASQEAAPGPASMGRPLVRPID